MQKPNAEKRRRIIEIAARLFATRPFHETRLDDVAAAAKVGKGTLYIYFRNKEELYFAVIHAGFARLLEELESRVVHRDSPQEALAEIVRRLVGFGSSHPVFFELLRSVHENQRRDLAAMRRRLDALITGIIRAGVRSGIWHDPNPRLTAAFIPGLIRSAMLHGPRGLGEKALVSQILRLLRHGLTRRKSR